MNRTGFEPDPRGTGGIEFWGQSFIAGADGRILVRAPVDREVVIVEEIDLAEIDAVRAGWPFFRDRRIDAYAEHHAAVRQRRSARARRSAESGVLARVASISSRMTRTGALP